MRELPASRKPDLGASTKESCGRLVAQVLSGAWRLSAPALMNSSVELEEIATLLMQSGAAGLAWSKVRQSELRFSPVADQLHQTYRLQSLQGALHERRLMQVIRLLRSVGVEPILVKGWAIARLYQEIDISPICAIDI